VIDLATPQNETTAPPRPARPRLEFRFPQVGGRRLACTGILCSAATALWIGAPAYLPGADLSLALVAAGVLVPGWTGFVTLLAVEHRILNNWPKYRLAGSASGKPREVTE
jgi:hypothetical protein